MPERADILGTETSGIHARLGTLPFFTALAAGTLPRTAIISSLRGLSIIHAVFEQSLTSMSSRPIADLRSHTIPKMPLLVANLEALDPECSPIVSAAIRGALDYATEIITGDDKPLTLAGILYALERSQNDGVVLKQAYARCLGVPEDLLSSIGCYGSSTAAHWKGFTGSLNALALDHDQHREVADAAVRCFERLGTIYARLHPYEGRDLEHHVTTVNYEAGHHAMPQDPLDIAVALRVGRASWTRYPYLESRFGERGKRFTTSDSCWLVALRRLSAEPATESLDWLREFLARRGIATVILEDHLAAISREFAAGSPGPPQVCALYERFLSNRAAERRALLEPETATRLVDEFDRRLRSCAGLTVASTARLIASAWVDERSGIEGALAAVRDWFVDDGRFSTDWIANIHELVERLDEAAQLSC